MASAAAHEPLEVQAGIDHPQLLRRALLVYFHDGAAREVEFNRSADGEFVAVVPADAIQPPGFRYTLELEWADGHRTAAFATRSDPHAVQVPDEALDVRERALLERIGGRRSLASAGFDYVDFGQSPAGEVDASSGATQSEQVRDRYYRIEAAYTYRVSRVVTEFSLRLGVVRGRSPVPNTDERTQGDDPFDVGLNYGAPTVKFRLTDWLHAEAEFLTSVTEVGFSVGGGAATSLGDPYGTHLNVGFESIQVFGTRFWSRLNIQAFSGIALAPIVEVSDMPHADDFGVRLLGEASAELGAGFHVALRGGYQARQSSAGGPGFGLTLGYAF